MQIYAAFTLVFVVYECALSGSLVHTRPPAEREQGSDYTAGVVFMFLGSMSAVC